MCTDFPFEKHALKQFSMMVVVAFLLVIGVLTVQPVSADSPTPDYPCPYCGAVIAVDYHCNSPECSQNPSGPHLRIEWRHCYDCEGNYYIGEDHYCTWYC